VEIRRQANGRSPTEGDKLLASDQPSCDDRFVIALGQEAKVRTDGVSAILGLLEWRYELAEAVLFHKTKVSAGAMLDRALYELWSGKTEEELVSKVLHLTDDELLDVAIKETDIGVDEAGLGRIAVAKKLLSDLKSRKLYKHLATFDRWNLAGIQAERAERTYSDHTQTRAAFNRAETARNIEADFELPPGSVVMYCAEVRAKLAQVSIAIDDKIQPFDEYEKDATRKLSGGHLEAQVNRFKGLWKVRFYIDRDIKARLGEKKEADLVDALKQVVLGTETGGAMRRVVQRFAQTYAAEEQAKGRNNVRYVENPSVAAKSDESVSTRPRYPMGTECTRNYLLIEG
jgi:hypothetical protein